MELNFADAATKDFNPELYIKILIAIAKADKFNGPREKEYVKVQAERFSLDFQGSWSSTDKSFSIQNEKVSRLTGLLILKDCIALATLDRSYSLAEKERIYTYAERLGIPRTDVDVLEKLLEEYKSLREKWDNLVNAE